MRALLDFCAGAAQASQTLAFTRKFSPVGLLIAAAMLVALPQIATAQQLEGPVYIGVIRPAPDTVDPLMAPVARSAEQGTIMAEEEFSFNASMFGFDFAIIQKEAQGEDVIAAAEELVDSDEVFALAGGFDEAEARLLSAWADERAIPFINLLGADDALRNELCTPSTFHMSPSAAMYLDALAGWYVRAGFRNWFTLVADTEVNPAERDRLLRGLSDRHFGAREVGTATLAADGTPDADTIAAIERSRADFVLLLMPAQAQLTALGALEAAGLDLMVTGFPDPAAQTREFFMQSSAVAPVLGSGMRAIAWEPTLDAYGARELNARYMQRWNEPMEQAAWATYQAVKAFFEAAMFTGATDPESVFAYLTAPGSVFDVWKGIGTSFRPWDHQMRQPLYLVDIDPDATEPRLAAQLVGELPAIYLPGTDPVERLDQLGDLAAQSRCHF